MEHIAFDGLSADDVATGVGSTEVINYIKVNEIRNNTCWNTVYRSNNKLITNMLPL